MQMSSGLYWRSLKTFDLSTFKIMPKTSWNPIKYWVKIRCKQTFKIGTQRLKLMTEFLEVHWQNEVLKIQKILIWYFCCWVSLYTEIILCNNKHLFSHLVVIFLLPCVIKNAVVVYHVLVDYIFLIFAFSWSSSDEKR